LSGGRDGLLSSKKLLASPGRALMMARV